ncbi:STAS domain-containing protein [Zooshikella marina]|uniref:Anti-sigma factor antagonist n=1 Tax=Zooshikella ganghwensis TaxID=202772 RepID=A0A4V1IND7_9GAMM|nr:STAS domain-containing protein [Zooshikella ganghwensis]MBU2708106.1 STAS domain-containing protein [Zooshikella ganghwensis]RDH43371.1 anti-sigma factor antagonist [Zooshikella ganghwensis]
MFIEGNFPSSLCITYKFNDQDVIAFKSDLDIKTVQAAHPLIERVIEEADSNVLVDMSAVNFIDSSGITALLYLYKRLIKANRTLSLIGVKEQPLHLLHLFGVNQVLTFYDSLDTCIQALSSPVNQV